MSNKIRYQAFASWRKGVLSDEELKQVVKDLESIVDIMCAMNHQSDLSMSYLRMELEQAKQMQRSRKRG